MLLRLAQEDTDFVPLDQLLQSHHYQQLRDPVLRVRLHSANRRDIYYWRGLLKLLFPL
jgi:hypothetical protein